MTCFYQQNALPAYDKTLYKRPIGTPITLISTMTQQTTQDGHAIGGFSMLDRTALSSMLNPYVSMALTPPSPDEESDRIYPGKGMPVMSPQRLRNLSCSVTSPACGLQRFSVR